MSEEAGRPELPRWLLEPPPPGKIDLCVNVGPGATLPPGFLEAVDKLLRAIEGGDVAGYRLGAGCDDFSCTGHVMSPCADYHGCPSLTYPCLVKTCAPLTCRIGAAATRRSS
jgi:hypothetical protein